MFTTFIEELKKFKSNEVLFGTFIVTVGILLSNFFSYLVQAGLGRSLSPSDYGTFNAFLSLSVLVGVPAGILSTSLIKISSELLGRKDNKAITSLFWKILLICVSFSLFLFLIIFINKGNIANFLNIDNFQLVLLFGAFTSISIFSVPSVSYLQGLLRFKGYSLFLIISSIFRFFLTVGAAFLGYKLYGVFVGLVVSASLNFLISYFLLAKNISVKDKVDISQYLKKIALFSIPVFFVQFGMNALNNIDVILVKKLFSPEVAGYYSGTVTLGKILLFSATIISTIMFPQISKLYSERKDHKKTFYLFFIIQHLIVIFGVLFYILFPEFIASVFFGSGFLEASHNLPIFSIFIGIYALINFMVLYFLAIDIKRIYLFLIPAIVIQYLSISYFTHSLTSVIYSNIFVALALYISLIITLLFVPKNNIIK